MNGYAKYDFDEDQKIEIQTGEEKGLDVSFYTKPSFLAIQMRQIRLGLEEGLDVSVYSKPEYDWFQMEEIRKGMKAGVQYEMYAKPEIDYKKMRQLRKGLQQGIDLSLYIQVESGILEQLRKAALAKISIIDYIKDGFEVEQLTQIRHALERRLNIRPYISVEHRGSSIREIALGLEAGVPVNMYSDIEYTWQQMREIRMGMEARLDVSTYANSLYTWQQMREIRLGLKDGVDVSQYSSFMYMASDMERIRLRLMTQSAEDIVNEAYIEKMDEQIAVFISNDEMEACIEVKCAVEEEISAYEIKERLRRYGICQGILDAEIEKLVQEKKYNRTVVAAIGKLPRRGEDGRYEFFFNTNPKKTPKILPDGSADFRAIEWFETVTKGDKVAYYHAAEYGMPGYTITGKVLQAQKGQEKNMLTGRGFILEADGKTYIAAIDGKIDLYEENRLEISDVYVVDEVSLSTGNINFNGSVYVNGNVGSNTAIYATENVVVNGFVESCTIRCGGEICLRQGVNGGGTGVIEAGKNVMGQFFEGVNVISGGDISAHYALNCNMQAAGTILFYGSRGLLIGGYTRAARGIQAYNIGNKVGLATVLNVGIDDKMMNQVRGVEYKIASVNKELAILNHSYQDFVRKYPPEVRNLMELFLKIENAIYTKELQLKALAQTSEQLEQQLQEMADARIVIHGALYEGTRVIVNNEKWDAFGVKDVTIRYHKKIVVESN